jgi:hypothetical protein
MPYAKVNGRGRVEAQRIIASEEAVKGRRRVSATQGNGLCTAWKRVEAQIPRSRVSEDGLLLVAVPRV